MTWVRTQSGREETPLRVRLVVCGLLLPRHDFRGSVFVPRARDSRLFWRVAAEWPEGDIAQLGERGSLALLMRRLLTS